MNRQHVATVCEQPDICRDVDAFDRHRIARSAIQTRDGVPSRHRRSVAPCDLHAVEVSDKPIIVAHLQRRLIERRHPTHREREPQIHRRIHIAHRHIGVRRVNRRKPRQRIRRSATRQKRDRRRAQHLAPYRDIVDFPLVMRRRSHVICEADVDFLLPIKVRLRLHPRRHLHPIHIQLLPARRRPHDMHDMMPLIIRVDLPRRADHLVAPSPRKQIPPAQIQQPVEAACAEVAVRHRVKSRRRLRRAKPQRRRIPRLRHIEIRRHIRARSAGKMQRLPLPNHARIRRVVSHPVQRRRRPRRDAVHRSVIKRPIRNRQPRARAIHLIPDPRRRSRPARIIKRLRRPSRTERPVRRHKEFPRRSPHHQILRIHHRPLAKAHIRPLRRVAIKERWKRPIRLPQRQVAARIIRERKIRVQLLRREPPIFRRGENDTPFAGIQRHVRERPAERLLSIIRQKPPTQTHRRRPVV